MGPSFDIEQTAIEEVLVVTPRRIADSRGWFSETFRASWCLDHIGRDAVFVQDNESFSRAGTLRGIHYQLPPSAQGKLVRVVSGSIYDVAVDLRRSSPTFGSWVGEILAGDSGRQMWIPEGFGHGFVALEDALVAYKTTAPYAPDRARAVAWDDASLAIDWRLGDADPILSDGDRGAPVLHRADIFA